jgi:hypothetical protein
VSGVPLANITVLGTEHKLKNALLQVGHKQKVEVQFHQTGELVHITALEQFTTSGAWTSDVLLQLLF